MQIIAAGEQASQNAKTVGNGTSNADSAHENAQFNI
jgi:hypothetical protein